MRQRESHQLLLGDGMTPKARLMCLHNLLRQDTRRPRRIRCSHVSCMLRRVTSGMSRMAQPTGRNAGLMERPHEETWLLLQIKEFGRQQQLTNYIHRQKDGRFLGWTDSIPVRQQMAFFLGFSLEHHYPPPTSNTPSVLRFTRDSPGPKLRVIDILSKYKHHDIVR
jgi:hypothetical protein